MKVLQINCVYDTGSTGTITKTIHNGLMACGYESLVLYGRGPKSKDRNTFKTGTEFYAKANRLCNMIIGLQYGGCHLETQRIIGIIKNEQPDLVHLQCVNGSFVNNYRLITWLKRSGLPVVLTLHAEFPYTANCSHALDCMRWQMGCGDCPRKFDATDSLLFDRSHESFLKMREAYEGFDDRLTVISVSPWLKQRAESSPVLAPFHHDIILNGIDTKIFLPTVNSCKEKLFTVLHVTASFSDVEGHIKGGRDVLSLAKRFEGEPVQFLVAGPVKHMGTVPENVRFLGPIFNQKEMAELYGRAGVTLLTSRAETFSMPVAESLCCGTPVVGFFAGAPEQIALREFSSFVPRGDLDALEQAIRRMRTMNYNRRSISQLAHENYSDEEMVRKYIDLYRSLTCN